MRAGMRLISAFVTLVLATIMSFGSPVSISAPEPKGLSDADIENGLRALPALLGVRLEGARWGRVEALAYAGQYGRADFEFKGNAWKLASDAASVQTADGMQVKLSDSEPTGEGRRETVVQGKWEEINIADDVAPLCDWLEKAAKKEAQAEAGKAADPDGSNDNGGIDIYALGRLRVTALRWAVALEASGHHAEALKVAAAVLKPLTQEKRAQLLDALVSAAASGELARRMEAFAGDHDWKKLGDALQSLIVAYPRGWPQLNAVRILKKRVDHRVANASPALKPARPLTAEQIGIVEAWIKDTEAHGSVERYDCWLLPPIGERAPPQKSFPASLGLAAVPLLAAMLGDDTLTLSTPSRSGMGYEGVGYNFDPFGGGNDSTDEDGQVTALHRIYQQLPRPFTRSELAAVLLTRILPQELQSSEHGALDGSSVQTVMEWWQEVKDLKPVDLALAYAEQRHHAQQAIPLILEKGDQAAIGKLEEILLAQAEPYSLDGLAPVVAKLGDRAKPFMAKLKRVIEAKLTQRNRDDADTKKRAEKAIAALERQLAAQSGDVPAAQILSEIIEKKTTYRDSYMALQVSLSKLPESERVRLLLEKALIMPDEQTALALVAYAIALPKSNDRNGEALPEDIVDAQIAATTKSTTLPVKKARVELLAANKSTWAKLLHLDFASAPQVSALRDYKKIQFVAALEAFLRADDKWYPKLDAEYRRLQPLGTRLTAIYVARGEEMLEGKEPAPMPDAKTPAAADVAKVWDELRALQPDALYARLPQVDPSMVLALNEKLAGEKEWPESFTKASRQITSVTVPAAWEAWKGREVTGESVFELATACTTGVDATHKLAAVLQRQFPLEGWSLTIEMTDVQRGSWEQYQFAQIAKSLGNKLDEASRVGIGWTTLPSEARNGGISWLNQPTKPTKPAEGSETAQSPAPSGDSEGALKELRRGEEAFWRRVLDWKDERTAMHGEPLMFMFSSASASVVKKAAELSPANTSE